MVQIKVAGMVDLDWVNTTYRGIQFLPSTLEEEIVAIAYEGDRYVGLGRLVVINSESCELGGMYVDPTCRNQGIASDIVTYLLARAQRVGVYCIPFLHLEQFYGRFGFKRIEKDGLTPIKVIEKLQFCKETYTEETILMVKDALAKCDD